MCTKEFFAASNLSAPSATNDANNDGDGSSYADDANTGGYNMRNQDSSRRNTARSSLEHQIQKSHALQFFEKMKLK